MRYRKSEYAIDDIFPKRQSSDAFRRVVIFFFYIVYKPVVGYINSVHDDHVICTQIFLSLSLSFTFSLQTRIHKVIEFFCCQSKRIIENFTFRSRLIDRSRTTVFPEKCATVIATWIVFREYIYYRLLEFDVDYKQHQCDSAFQQVSVAGKRARSFFLYFRPHLFRFSPVLLFLSFSLSFSFSLASGKYTWRNFGDIHNSSSAMHAQHVPGNNSYAHETLIENTMLISVTLFP